MGLGMLGITAGASDMAAVACVIGRDHLLRQVGGLP